jgi:hypothetical protein
MFEKLKLLVCIFIAVLATGCATVSGSGTSQPISVQTLASDGTEAVGVRCDMSNDEGTWFVTTPGSTTVKKSNKDLQVVCKKTGMDIGTASVVSRTKGNMWANVIIGGGIGAIIDHNNGAAYEYPGLITVFMGRANQKIEANSQQLPVAESQNIQKPDSSQGLDKAKKECEEIGLKVGSEQFGNCVMRLAK